MFRDDIRYKTNVTNVTDSQKSPNSTFFPKPHTEFITKLTSHNESGSSRGQFYYTYNPETGVNTATVLGGILVLLVIYVMYRTKCRKRIVKVFDMCIMKYFPEEFPPEPAESERDNGSKKAKRRSWCWENSKDNAKEQADVTLTDERHRSHDVESCKADLPCSAHQMTVPPQANDQCAISKPCSFLPGLEDVEKTTAQWVQSVRKMDAKERQLNGIILKIPPDLLSYHSKFRRYFSSVTEYSVTDFSEDLPATDFSPHRNVSLPTLFGIIKREKDADYAKTLSHSFHSKTMHCGYVPLASQENIDLELDNEADYLPQPFQNDVDLLSNTHLDICPIVKVQHYNSRSKRRFTSLCLSSSEEASSASSDSINGVMSLNDNNNSVRLQTFHPDLHNNSHCQRQNNSEPPYKRCDVGLSKHSSRNSESIV